MCLHPFPGGQYAFRNVPPENDNLCKRSVQFRSGALRKLKRSVPFRCGHSKTSERSEIGVPGRRGVPECSGVPECPDVPDAVPAFRNALPAFRNVPARAHRFGEAFRSVPFRGAPAPPSVPFRSGPGVPNRPERHTTPPVHISFVFPYRPFIFPSLFLHICFPFP